MLAALVLGGVVIGLVIVYYYPEISNSSTASEAGPCHGMAPAGIMRACPRPRKGPKALQRPAIRALLDALSEAVESGAGLPAVARAAARLLDASVALIDRSSAVLAVAGASPDQEQKLLSGGEGVTAVELRVADAAVGELRYRAASAAGAGDRPHGDDAAGAGAGALARARSGRARRWPAPSSPPCSPAR